jgi:uncharacterized protein YndB with AHSA1/START domain
MSSVEVWTPILKIGGAYRIHMVSEKGGHAAVGKYREIVPNKRLQFTWQREDNDGRSARRS